MVQWYRMLQLLWWDPINPFYNEERCPLQIISHLFLTSPFLIYNHLHAGLAPHDHFEGLNELLLRQAMKFVYLIYNWCVLHHLAWSKFTSIRTLAVSFLGRFFHSRITHSGTFIPTRTFLAVHIRRTRAAAAAINLSWHAWMKKFFTHGLLGAKVCLRKLGKRDAIDVEAPGGYCALKHPVPLLQHVQNPHEPESALVFVQSSPATMKSSFVLI